MTPSYVILVDAQDKELGLMEKMQAHQEGLLHRAFSVFVINNNNQMLLQKRALEKYHSPGLWTNACCSHPYPNENTLVAANRRLQEEMGFNCNLKELGSFTYKTSFDNGLTEHEYDHVFIGNYNGPITVNPEEVDSFKWVSFDEIDEKLINNKHEYTFWFQVAFPLVKGWLAT